LFSRTKVIDSLDTGSDGILDQGENGVIAVVTVAFGKGFNGYVKHLLLDLGSIGSSQSFIDFSGSIFNDFLDIFSLVQIFIGFGSLENVESSFVDVVLEVLVFVDQEVVNRFSLNSLKFAVNMPVVHLSSANSN